MSDSNTASAPTCGAMAMDFVPADSIEITVVRGLALCAAVRVSGGDGSRGFRLRWFRNVEHSDAVVDDRVVNARTAMLTLPECGVLDAGCYIAIATSVANNESCRTARWLRVRVVDDRAPTELTASERYYSELNALQPRLRMVFDAVRHVVTLPDVHLKVVLPIHYTRNDDALVYVHLSDRAHPSSAVIAAVSARRLLDVYGFIEQHAFCRNKRQENPTQCQRLRELFDVEPALSGLSQQNCAVRQPPPSPKVTVAVPQPPEKQDCAAILQPLLTPAFALDPCIDDGADQSRIAGAAACTVAVVQSATCANLLVGAINASSFTHGTALACVLMGAGSALGNALAVRQFDCSQDDRLVFEDRQKLATTNSSARTLIVHTTSSAICSMTSLLLCSLAAKQPGSLWWQCAAPIAKNNASWPTYIAVGAIVGAVFSACSTTAATVVVNSPGTQDLDAGQPISRSTATATVLSCAMRGAIAASIGCIVSRGSAAQVTTMVASVCDASSDCYATLIGAGAVGALLGSAMSRCSSDLLDSAASVLVRSERKRRVAQSLRLLGMPASCQWQTQRFLITQRYRAIARVVHPDKLTAQQASIGGRLTAALNRARSVLAF